MGAYRVTPSKESLVSADDMERRAVHALDI